MVASGEIAVSGKSVGTIALAPGDRSRFGFPELIVSLLVRWHDQLAQM
jgi:hypothetical protein